MRSRLAYLPKAQTKQLRSIITHVAQATGAELIICFGTRSNLQLQWSPFLPVHRPCRAYQGGTYEMFLVMPDDAPFEEKELNRLIDTTINNEAAFFWTFKPLATVKQLLAHRDFFTCTLFRQGYLLHARETATLHKEPIPAPNRNRKERLIICQQRLQYAQECFNEAELALEEDHYRAAVQLLSKSFAFTLNALILGFIGYECGTHNLVSLRACAWNFYSIHFPLFEYDQALFRLLHHAPEKGMGAVSTGAKRDYLEELLREVWFSRSAMIGWFREHLNQQASEIQAPSDLLRDILRRKPFPPHYYACAGLQVPEVTGMG